MNSIHNSATDKAPMLLNRSFMNGLFAGCLILIIQGYQKIISPWMGRCCRFHPTCSHYCIDALKQHGMFYGLWLSIRRIFKCHPLHPGGYDAVPKSSAKECVRK